MLNDVVSILSAVKLLLIQVVYMDLDVAFVAPLTRSFVPRLAYPTKCKLWAARDISAGVWLKGFNMVSLEFCEAGMITCIAIRVMMALVKAFIMSVHMPSRSHGHVLGRLANVLDLLQGVAGVIPNATEHTRLMDLLMKDQVEYKHVMSEQGTIWPPLLKLGQK